MVAIQRLGDDDLLDLAQRTNKLGVLSVYADTDPRQDLHLQATAIDLRNRFRELQNRVAEDADPDNRRAMAAALDRLWPQVEDLTNPTASGRSRIVFIALEGDWSLQLDSALPVANRLVLDDGAFIHPLLELLDEGRPAGVVVVSTEDARLLEWRVGSAQLLSRMERRYIEAPHERAGQIGGGPKGQFNTPMREQRQAREDERVERFLDGVVKLAAELARDRGWERMLVSGGEHWTGPIVARFPDELRDMVCTDTRVLNGLDDGALATTVTAWAHEQHRERERRLLQQLRDAAGSGSGVLGLSEVVAALSVGRVAHLVYDPEVRYVGSLGVDGALYGGDEVGADGRPGTVDPRFTERLVERALQTGARISPVEGATRAELSDAAGIGALLRW
ncbi:MAG TPA: hypothetical protein VFQ37_16085 [Mycobacterium sp.]|nr:hypothetical protein [Mycobacterium sp.]